MIVGKLSWDRGTLAYVNAGYKWKLKDNTVYYSLFRRTLARYWDRRSSQFHQEPPTKVGQTWFAHLPEPFYKDSETGLNSKVAFGTYVGNSQDTAEYGLFNCDSTLSNLNLEKEPCLNP